LEPDGSALGVGVIALAVLGEAERAKEWTERALLLDPDNLHLVYDLACAHVELREFETALDLLERALGRSAHIEFLNWTKTDPDLDPIRDHPRFVAIVAATEARLARA
jgi:adenylate cyclase